MWWLSTSPFSETPSVVYVSGTPISIRDIFPMPLRWGKLTLLGRMSIAELMRGIQELVAIRDIRSPFSRRNSRLCFPLYLPISKSVLQMYSPSPRPLFAPLNFIMLQIETRPGVIEENRSSRKSREIFNPKLDIIANKIYVAFINVDCALFQSKR